MASGNSHFYLPQRQFRPFDPRSRDQGDRIDRRAGSRAHHQGAGTRRLAAYGYPGHRSSPRPCRRRRRSETKYNCRVVAPARQVHGDRQCRPARRPWRRHQGRWPLGAGAGNPRPYARPYLLCVRQREGAVRRRYALLDRMRPGVRGHLPHDVGFAAEAACAAGRFQTLLRPRVYRRQRQICAHGRGPTIPRCRRAPPRWPGCARRTSPRSRPCWARKRRPTCSCVPTSRRSPENST